MLSRRKFLQQSTFGATGLLGAFYAGNSLAFAPTSSQDDLYTFSRRLAATWGETLLRLQVKDPSHKHYGTIIYPPEDAIHGRMGDTIYPFLHLAKTTGRPAYLDAAELLFRWMERMVSQSDGSWLNDPVPNAWKGTTVFTSIALAEAVKQHGDIMDHQFRQAILARLQKSGDFIYNNFSINYGNINYPIAASYGLSLLGELLDVSRFRQRGKEFAHEALRFITKEGFLSGEGGPHTPSPKGCLSVDLGYNVEESLPSLVLYSLLTDDKEVLDVAVRAMETHMEFMLPDGGWDNSWGTRNYKWTYWGSRTSDGCQPAYALMAARNPAFYKVALRNTELLQACTKDGILQGGLHYHSHGVPASLHHTFCHLKALVTILDHHAPPVPKEVLLPREKTYGSRFFNDIQTVLISQGMYRATVTGYDRNYKNYRAGHASGGALSMLWHEKAGVLLAASMNEYQRYEQYNMQADTDPLSMPLTPRIELQEGGTAYMNINDFTAVVSVVNDTDGVTVNTSSKLVDKDQQHPSSGEVTCEISYRFTEKKITIHFRHDGDVEKPVRIIIPVISSSEENMKMISPQALEIFRKDAVVQLSADKEIGILPMTADRIFNFVPGLEALPFFIKASTALVEIKVI